VVSELGAKYEIRESGAVDHTLWLYLLDRDGKVARKFDQNVDARELAKAMKAL